MWAWSARSRCVGAEGDGRVRVSELPGDEDDVQALGDQQRCEGVAQGVERESTGCGYAGLLDRGAKGFAGVAVVESAALRGAEDELLSAVCRGRRASVRVGALRLRGRGVSRRRFARVFNSEIRPG